MRDLLYFDARIGREFRTSDAVYKYTCGKTDCDFSCGVPHLSIIVRVRGLADDRIGIRLDTACNSIDKILPQAPGGRYSYRTWRNSRYHIIRRMLLCAYIYYMRGDLQRIMRLVSKPLHVYMLGFVMGRVLDLQRRLALGGFYELDDDKSIMLAKEFQ